MVERAKPTKKDADPVKVPRGWKRDFAIQSKKEKEDENRGHHGVMFEAGAKDRIARFAPETGHAMFSVPEAESRKMQFESAIEAGMPGPGGEVGIHLGEAYMAANIAYYRAIEESDGDESSRVGARNRVAEFMAMQEDPSAVSKYFLDISRDFRRSASKLAANEVIDEDLEFRIQQSRRNADNWSALAQAMIAQIDSS